MSKTQEALKLALEALEESLGYVQEEAENAQRLYGQYPTRQARIQGLKDDARKHMDAITALREALAEQPAQQEAQIVRWNCPCGNKYTFHGFTQAPPQRTWVGLDNDDLIWVYSNSDKVGQAISNTEAKLKEKNT